MRPKGLIALVVVIGIVAGIAYLLSDRFIERGIESTGEAIVGAKVEVDNLNFSLLDLSISMERLQVTNPNDTWKNMFETGRMSFDMDLNPLTFKKVIIRDATLADIRVGTRRATDGKLPDPPEPAEPGWVDRAKESMKRQIEAVPVLNLAILQKKVDVDQVFASLDLQSNVRLDSLKQDVESTYQLWSKTIANFDPQDELSKVETQIDQLKSKKLDNIPAMLAAVDQVKSIHGTLDNLKEDLESKKSLAGTDVARLTQSFADIDNWVANDLNRLKSYANIGDFSAQNIATMLFGQNVMNTVTDLLYYVSLTRKYMPVAKQVFGSEDEERPPRLEGQTVHFPFKLPWPDLLIENILVSAASNQEDTSKVIRLSGQVNGITSQPRVYGKPMQFRLTGQLPQSRTYQLSGEFDHTGDAPSESIQAKAIGLAFGSMKLPERPYLPVRIDAEKADAITDVKLRGEEIGVTLSLNARPVNFVFSDSLARDDVISRVTRGVFDSIDLLQLSAKVTGQADGLKLSIHSNIDDILSNRIKNVVGESVRVARAEIENRLNAIVAPKKREVEALFSRYQKELSGEINKIESSINNQVAFVDQYKKEMEDKIKKEQAKGVEDLTKKLKSIIDN